MRLTAGTRLRARNGRAFEVGRGRRPGDDNAADVAVFSVIYQGGRSSFMTETGHACDSSGRLLFMDSAGRPDPSRSEDAAWEIRTSPVRADFASLVRPRPFGPRARRRAPFRFSLLVGAPPAGSP